MTDHARMRYRADDALYVTDVASLGMRAKSCTWLRGMVSALARDVLALLDENARLRDALEHLGSPNDSVRATGRDAVDMAGYAREKLNELTRLGEEFPGGYK